MHQLRRRGYSTVSGRCFEVPFGCRLARSRVLAPKRLGLSDCKSRILVERKEGALAEEEDGYCQTMSFRSNKAPAPNRRPRVPLGIFREFAYHLCAPPSSPAAVGEAHRSASSAL